MYAITTGGSLISPTIGGLVYTKLGYYEVYILAGGLLVIDVILRLLVVEKGTSAGFSHQPTEDDEWSSSAGECSPLLRDCPRYVGSTNEEMSNPRASFSFLQRHFPLLSIIKKDSRLLVALLVTFYHACLVGTFNATIPIHVQRTFQMTSLDSGLLFIAIEVPYMVLGPIVGRAVDRSGPRNCATLGNLLLVPALYFLRFPHGESDSSRNSWQVVFYVSLLVLNGIGLTATSASAFVQANNVGREHHLKEPGRFGKKGPHGQLYALNNVMYSLGTTLGPLISGGLAGLVGYGNAMAVMALQAGVMALAAFLCMDSRNDQSQ